MASSVKADVCPEDLDGVSYDVTWYHEEFFGLEDGAVILFAPDKDGQLIAVGELDIRRE